MDLQALSDRTERLGKAINNLSGKLEKFNPYHDTRGRFSSGAGGGAALGANLKSGNKSAALKRVGGLLTNSRQLQEGAMRRGDTKTGSYAMKLHSALLKARDSIKAGRFKTARNQLIAARGTQGIATGYGR